MTLADQIVDFLARQGTTRIFGFSGGMITPLLDAIGRRDCTQLINMRHEQGAAFAAEGWARITGKPGVAIATSGPGATNLLTGIGSCHFDGVPALFLTGNVPLHESMLGRQPGPRQWGFQETNIAAMAYPVTKMSAMALTVGDAQRALLTGYAVATSRRPGPVLIDLPFDVQRQEAPEFEDLIALPGVALPDDVGKRILGILQGAERPLVLVGGGCARRPAVAELLATLGVPVVHTLLGKDVFAGSVGMIGTYGNRWANKALVACDVLLVLGARLDLRQTGSNPERLFEGKKLVLVDVEPAEATARAGHTHTRVTADVGKVCESMLRVPTDVSAYEWREQVAAWRAEYPDTEEHPEPCVGINPNMFMRQLGQTAAVKAYTVDVGAHQMWAAQSLRLRQGQRFLTSGGMGAMGFALPAAIGASLALDRAPVAALMGDGGAQINIQELRTLKELGLPVKVFIFNNSGHGMVRQMQCERFERRLVGTDVRPPDFVAIAEAYGLRAYRAKAGIDAEVEQRLNAAGPVVIEVPINPSVGAWPKAKYGSRLDEMDPPKP